MERSLPGYVSEGGRGLRGGGGDLLCCGGGVVRGRSYTSGRGTSGSAHPRQVINFICEDEVWLLCGY